jgi:hypothetical protein
MGRFDQMSLASSYEVAHFVFDIIIYPGWHNMSKLAKKNPDEEQKSTHR